LPCIALCEGLCMHVMGTSAGAKGQLLQQQIRNQGIAQGKQILEEERLASTVQTTTIGDSDLVL
jgi:hypothetical protein